MYTDESTQMKGFVSRPEVLQPLNTWLLGLQPQLIAQSGLGCGEESWVPLALSDLECRSL